METAMAEVFANPGGHLTDQLRMRLEQEVLKLPVPLREAIGFKFSPNDFREDAARSDGFKPRTIDPIALLRRLEDTFDWSLTIRSVQIDHHARVAYAIVSIGWKYWVNTPSDRKWVETHRDGLGTCRMSVNQSGYVDPDYAMKTAVTDAIKLAAKHIGIGREAWERPPVVQSPEAQHAQAQRAAQPACDPNQQPAQEFQVQSIIDFFETKCGMQRVAWMAYLQLADPSQITYGLAQQILSGQHPFVQAMSQQYGHQIGGMKVTAAR
jgi:hypothetical protein